MYERVSDFDAFELPGNPHITSSGKRKELFRNYDTTHNQDNLE